MKVSAKLNNLRVSPRKVRLVTDVIKGKDVSDALIELNQLVKRSSPLIAKLLNSAVANAENNNGLDRNNLYVFDIQVGEGPRLKRWSPRAYGRATQILKRTSKVTLTLEERVEGRNRKTKEQMEKERKEREEEKKKLEKEIKEERGQAEEKEPKTPFMEEREEKEEQKKEKGIGWMKRIFRRKSG